jgi:hypothetical protein
MKKLFILSLVFLFSLSFSMAGFINVGSGSNTNVVVDSTGSNIRIGYVPSCGNGWLDSGEQCDGSRLDGQSCTTLGYDAGTLSCSSSCVFEVSACYDNNNDNPTNDGGIGDGGGSGGGGGGSSCTGDANWLCNDWDVCDGGTQERICTTDCGLEANKPAETRSCTVEGESGDAGLGLSSDDGQFTSLFTGAFLGASGQVWTGIGVFALIVILGVIGYWWFNRN